MSSATAGSRSSGAVTSESRSEVLAVASPLPVSGLAVVSLFGISFVDNVWVMFDDTLTVPVPVASDSMTVDAAVEGAKDTKVALLTFVVVTCIVFVLDVSFSWSRGFAAVSFVLVVFVVVLLLAFIVVVAL